MKRIKFALCVLLAVVLFALGCCALAETNPVNPYYRDAQLPKGEIQKSSRGTLNARLECLQEPTYEVPGIWKVNVSGAVGECLYRFYICDDQYDDGVYENTNVYVKWQSDNTISFQCVVPGDYIVFAYVSDGENSVRDYLYFTIEGDADHPSIDEIIDDVAARCIAAGCKTDYEKALWLHDYLIDNADYDYTYTYYSVDGVLVRGTGVCDSYRKAYERLLLAVGVDAVSVGGGGHAWNMVKLNGEWSNVDVTWDDSSYEGEYFRYRYFGVPTDLMEVNHSFEAYPHECTSYDQHYYIRSGFVSLWADKFLSGINNALGNGEWSFALDAPVPYIIGNGWMIRDVEHIVYGMTAHALEKADWTANGRALELTADYDQAASVIRFEVPLDDMTLTLPAGLTSIEAAAFTGDDGFMAVVIPDGAERIGAKAFSGCENLWKVVVPDSVTDIAADAFKGCGNVTIVCSMNSAAYRFAQANGLRTLIA